MDLKMKQLAMAAIEMNQVMGLKPKIKTVGCTTESLIEEILTNAAEIDPELDEFSPETEAVLRKLKCWPGTEVKQEEPDEDDKEPVVSVKKKKEVSEPDPEDEDVDEDEEPVSKLKRPIQREEDDDVVVRARAEKQIHPVPEKVYNKPEKKEKVQKQTNIRAFSDPSKSNKGIVYSAWVTEETLTPDQLHLRCNKKVLLSTIKIWLKQWKNGKNLPAVAKII